MFKTEMSLKYEFLNKNFDFLKSSVNIFLYCSIKLNLLWLETLHIITNYNKRSMFCLNYITLLR